MSARPDSFYDVMRRQGITRRSFLKFCSLTASSLALGPQFVGKIAHAMETKPRIAGVVAAWAGMHLLFGIVYPFRASVGEGCDAVHAVAGL